MHRVFVQTYLKLGMSMSEADIMFTFLESDSHQDGGALSAALPKKKIVEELDEPGKDELRETLTKMHDFCREIGLSTSRRMLKRALIDLPETSREFAMLRQTIMSEMKERLFLFVPGDRARYYESDSLVSDLVKKVFPSATRELRSAGNCYAAAQFTACVFHLMRAAEVGVRVLGDALNVSFPTHPLELADWQNILDQADSKIVAMKNLPRGTHKDEELHFYSQAAVQFRYFKDAWRVRVAHARETFGEDQALTIMRHTCEFFEVLAPRLTELEPWEIGRP